MARRSADALAKQKEARQKKMLIALVPVLLLLLAWQGPGMLKAFSGGTPPPEAAPAPATQPTGTTPAPDPAAGAPPTTATGAPPAGAPAPPGALADTDLPVEPDAGQLVSFDRFVGKDPFRQQVVAKESDGDADGNGDGDASTSGGGDDDGDGKDGAAGGGDDGDGSGTSGGSGSGPVVGPAPMEPAPAGGERTSATVDVNGTREEVFLTSTFPTIDPIFRIVSISAKSAKLELVTGQFSNGRATLTLKLRKPLTLVSQPDGLRYVITLLATGNNSS
jgi:hypothetical protein